MLAECGSITFVIILLAVIVWTTGPSVKLNPKRTIRTLNLPFRQIMYPSISADGNWIAFPAVDVNGDWNIYLFIPQVVKHLALEMKRNNSSGHQKFHLMVVMCFMVQLIPGVQE